jgi:PAS domain S-box-containing protein
VFAGFAFSASIICSLLAIIVYFFNRKSQLNRIFISAILFGAYSAFTAFMVLQANTAEDAYFWNKVGFLWPFFTVLLFQFALVFTENRFAGDKRGYILLYLPAVAFSVLDLATDQLGGYPRLEFWGYVMTGSETVLRAASNVWSILLSCSSVLLCARYFLRVTDESKKQQAKLITIGLSYPLLATLLAGIANVAFAWSIPRNGSGANAILCVFVAYAMWKYDLFNINPSLAAENIITTMPDSFILTDSKGEILRANPALTNLLGYEEHELAGKTVSQLITTEHLTSILRDIAEKQEIKNRETQLKTKQGTQKPVAVSASAIKNKKGKNIGITFVIHDLTRRKQNEEKIVRTERFAAIGELAGMIGHDLRNPLTSIQGATYYLKRKYAQNMDNSGKEMLNTIERSIIYSNKIVNDLLDYSREIKLEIEETSAKTLVANALALTDSPQNIKVVDLTTDTPELQVDTAKITRVFLNLIKNAIDAMPKGGTLTITNTETEDYLEIVFVDTGTGMTQETINKLWTPLFTTKARGMGFGLPICKRIVEAHGGKIQVQSTSAKGTTIIITIPLNIEQHQKTTDIAVGAIIDLGTDTGVQTHRFKS